MKKLILIALVCSALYSSATGYFGIKPIVNEPNCYGANTGSIQLSVLGGTAPFQYAWSNGGSTILQTNLAAGSYAVTVTDANNLTTSYTVILAQPFQINASTSTANATAHGANNGYINLNVDGGTPGYTFDWSNGSTAQNQTGLAAGTYTCTITDAVGCIITASKTITQPAAPFYNGRVAQSGNQARDLGATDNTGDVRANTSAELKSSDVQVYPNPASNLFTLKTGEVSNAHISLIDINGQIVSQQKAESNETGVNVSNLPKGNYIIEVKTETGSVVNKSVTIVK